MTTFLFDKIIFGPVNSRRLGVSLGINLLPTHSKFCNFNCIYCECGWTPEKGQMKSDFHTIKHIIEHLESFLNNYSKEGKTLDTITFAGNGEPTLHPNFEKIIDQTILLRNQFYPKAKISVLSNATMLHAKNVVNALKKVDNCILKLDGGTENTIQALNQPLKHFSLDKIIQQFSQFKGQFILQTMFLKGQLDGKEIDNTSPAEIDAYLNVLQKLTPKKVMIYTIARDTPSNTLEKISIDKLRQIEERIKVLGLSVEVSG